MQNTTPVHEVNVERREHELVLAQKAKIDLHCHSQASSTPGIWFLRQIGCSESYTPPESVYELAMNRGMDFVTITDHNVIHGAKEIEHYDNFIVGTEVTSLFPDKVKVHVVCLDISDQQHEEINRIRYNIYELVDYLAQEEIIHFVAHPLYKVNGDLTWEHFEKLILLFKRHEVLNGGRYERINRVTEQLLSSLTSADIERLADKHNLSPVGERPWEKFYVGGSDDHGGLFVGSCYTEVLVDEMTKKGVLDGIRDGRTNVCGKTDGSLTLAHQISSVAYQYLASKMMDDASEEALVLKQIFNRNGGKNGSVSLKEIKKLAFGSRKGIFKSIFGRKKEADTFSLIGQVRAVVENNPNLVKIIQQEALTDEEFNHQVFSLATELLDRLVVQVTKRPAAINPLLTWGAGIFLTYFISMSSVSKNCDLLQQAEALIDVEKHKKVAWFTDRYHGVDGVVVTVKKFLAASLEYNCDLNVVIADDNIDNHPEGVKAFPAITTFQLPMYSDIVGKLYVPSFLKIARWMEEEEFDSVVISTPGPMGFAGMIAAKILGLPITAIYHTDLPRYSYELTDDFRFANIVTHLTKAFYDVAERILVPSHHYAEELKGWGINPDKIDFLKRWVNGKMFSPQKRSNNGIFGYKKGAKLLYVGRISKEKNLDFLLQVHAELSRRDKDFCIYCVGEGPYLEKLKQNTAGVENFELPGPKFGEELATIYASADAFIFPSLTDSFGNVVLEAQASGLPCVVMNQGGPKEIVADGKSGIVAQNEEEFINATERLILDSELRAQMSAQAVVNAKRFDKEEIFMNFWRGI